MRAMDWTPRLQAGAALARDRFAIAIGELEYDGQFTAILSFDGRVSQPWQRIDVEREIVDLAWMTDDGPTLHALSSEGDVYTIHEDRVDRSKIPGAGVLSDDAAGYGATFDLLIREKDVLVLGAGRQLYLRQGATVWQTLSADKNHPPGSGQKVSAMPPCLGIVRC